MRKYFSFQLLLIFKVSFLFININNVNGFISPQIPLSKITLQSNANSNESTNLETIATERFPTSIEDQVRQATLALRAATSSSIHRHSIRLLLPLIGATELDDWPGGAQQQMEAAAPLVQSILKQIPLDAKDRDGLSIQSTIFEPVDGIQALFAYNDENPQKDSCSILLPTADTVSKIQELDVQVGPTRDLILVNPEWRRPSDFSSSSPLLSFFSKDEKSKEINYVETFYPTFVCSNLMVEGDQIRILRSYPGPWRVFLQIIENPTALTTDQMKIDWIEIGSKPVQETNNAENSIIFDYGKPTYQEITNMIESQDGYVPKSVTERAAAAFTFIKDTL